MPDWQLYDSLIESALTTSAPFDYRAIYQPAFHADTCITISGRELRLAWLEEGARSEIMSLVGVRCDSRRGGGRIEKIATVSPEQRSALDARVRSIGLPKDSPEIGIDGVRVTGQIGSHLFRDWSPREPGFFVALIEVAREVIDDPLLAELARYFND